MTLENKCSEDGNNCSVSSVKVIHTGCLRSVVKNTLGQLLPSLPEQRQCVIDLYLYFMPEYPKTGEVLENLGIGVC